MYSLTKISLLPLYLLNFEKPSTQEIFRIILIDAAKYEEIKPLKSVRGNKVYIICNHTLESITCDDNGV